MSSEVPPVTQTLRGLAGEKLFHWRGDQPVLAMDSNIADTALQREAQALKWVAFDFIGLPV